MITPGQLEWVAGFLEGEATFRFDGQTMDVRVGQVSALPIDRLEKLFGGSRRIQKTAHQPQHRWTLSGIAAAGLSMTLYPLVLQKREQIRQALSQWRSRPAFNRYRRTCRVGHLLPVRGKRACRACHRDDNRRRRESTRKDTRTGELFLAAQPHV